MDRSSIRADHSNKIYGDRGSSSNDRFNSPADDRIADADADAIRMLHYRGPLAIVCGGNERVNCRRSMNRKSRALPRPSRELIGALLAQEDLFCPIWRVYLSTAPGMHFWVFW